MRSPRVSKGSRSMLVALGLAGAALGLVIGSVPARADICFELWKQRNSIYKAYGYCFKTQKAKEHFGNAGCIYKNEADIPMSFADKKTVLAIKKREKQLGCL